MVIEDRGAQRTQAAVAFSEACGVALGLNLSQLPAQGVQIRDRAVGKGGQGRERLEVAFAMVLVPERQQALGRSPCVKGRAAADGHGSLECLGRFNGVDADPVGSLDDVQVDRLAGRRRQTLEEGLAGPGDGVGPLQGVDKTVENHSQVVFAADGILGDEAAAFQHLQETLHRGRAETQMEAQLPHAPGGPLGLKREENTQGFFDGIETLNLFHYVEPCFVYCSLCQLKLGLSTGNSSVRESFFSALEGARASGSFRRGGSIPEKRVIILEQPSIVAIDRSP